MPPRSRVSRSLSTGQRHPPGRGGGREPSQRTARSSERLRPARRSWTGRPRWRGGILPDVELLDGEPRFGPWRIRRIDDVLRGVVARQAVPVLLAVDGRSGSGKTTAARRIAEPGAGRSSVVHTDDIAWYHAMFDWSAADRRRRARRRCVAATRVTFRPLEWDARDRPGAVTVPAGCPLVVVEGVGIGRRDLGESGSTALVWVQTDRALALGARAWPAT